MKLTDSQQKALNRIKDYINLAKECETIREYYIREHTDDFRDRKDYESIVSNELQRFNNLTDKDIESYSKYWINARENNIALTSNVSSATLRALEKKGLIEIVEDGGRYVDKVRLV